MTCRVARAGVPSSALSGLPEGKASCYPEILLEFVQPHMTLWWDLRESSGFLIWCIDCCFNSKSEHDVKVNSFLHLLSTVRVSDCEICILRKLSGKKFLLSVYQTLILTGAILSHIRRQKWVCSASSMNG